jgi:NarL family two-component system response regulator LiaR
VIKCPNCGQKTYGDSCQWCKYPIIRRRFPWQVRRKAQLKQIAEPVELNTEQAIKDTREEYVERVIRTAVEVAVKAEDKIKTAKQADEEAMGNAGETSERARQTVEALKKAADEATRLVDESKHKVEQLAEKIEGEAKTEAEQIIKEGIQKVKEETEEEWTIAMDNAGKTVEQIAEQAMPSQGESSRLQSHNSRVPEEVQVTGKIKGFIVDNQGLFRQGLRLFLSQTNDIELIAESDFLEYTAELIEELEPDLVLIDINLPWLSGLGLAQQVSRRAPDTSVIMLTSYEDDNQIFVALKAGVAGYLSKDTTPERLANAIRRVFKGEHIIDELLVRPGVAQRVLKQPQGTEKEDLIKPLSPQEMEVLGYFVKGNSRKQVADAMGVSEQQIMQHMASIVSKNLSPNGRI